MCRANKAIVRQRHPMPTVDEVLQDLNQCTCDGRRAALLLTVPFGGSGSHHLLPFPHHCGFTSLLHLHEPILPPSCVPQKKKYKHHGCVSDSLISSLSIHSRHAVSRNWLFNFQLERTSTYTGLLARYRALELCSSPPFMQF